MLTKRKRNAKTAPASINSLGVLFTNTRTSFSVECSLGIFLCLILWEDFLSVVPKFQRRWRCVRLWNSGATGGKSATKAGAGKTPRGHLLLFLLVFRFPTHVFGGSQVQNSSCKYACIRFITFCLWYHKYIIFWCFFRLWKEEWQWFYAEKNRAAFVQLC